MQSQKILTCISGDEEIAKECARLLAESANHAQSEVLLFHCFSNNPGGKSAVRVAAVQTAMEILDDANIEYQTIEDSGDPASRILDAEKEYEPDFILLGKSRRSTADKTLFGSVTERVMKETTSPVIYV